MHGVIVVIFAICQLAFRIAAGLQCKDFNFFLCVYFLSFCFLLQISCKMCKIGTEQSRVKVLSGAAKARFSLEIDLPTALLQASARRLLSSSFPPDMLFHLSFASLLLPSIVVNQALAGPPP
jgi:hypothetical protein